MTAEQIRQGVWMIVIAVGLFLVLGYLLGTDFGAAPSHKTWLVWMIAFMGFAFPGVFLAHEHEELQRRQNRR
ncbi:hypothetical protein CKO28_02765 [Rhodovibrio sodomensis]|uniref:Uncharacterized protein n=1 Tax=Rhodovibrio sodomensis TaxID=1088 RepID=A0ABS1DC45_9PROT|nr:hypothetical protein [Rhodovibrio sodomensis]MBK1666965.1 hypothetical protein [Rhodovibrio sodomensis]